MPNMYSGGFSKYEDKLRHVMERMKIKEYNYDWGRSSCFIEFTYGSQFYRFEHSLEKAAARKQKITKVSDLFAQLVLSLEDICRMSERGIYELSKWIEGMKALPPSSNIPSCFYVLGFQDIPSLPELELKYKQLAKISHPDRGGNTEVFQQYVQAYNEAKQILSANSGGK